MNNVFELKNENISYFSDKAAKIDFVYGSYKHFTEKCRAFIFSHLPDRLKKTKNPRNA
jgi:hypothetical protein